MDEARPEGQIRWHQTFYLPTTCSPTISSLVDVNAGGYHGAMKMTREETLVDQGTLSNDPCSFTLYLPSSAWSWSPCPHRRERRREKGSAKDGNQSLTPSPQCSGAP